MGIKRIMSIMSIAAFSFSLFYGCTKGSAETGSSGKETTISTGTGETVTKQAGEDPKQDEPKKESSGLLLGLASDMNENEDYDSPIGKKPNKYRALWISFDGDQLIVKQLSEAVAAPVGDNFYEIGNDLYTQSEVNPDPFGEDIYLKYNYFYSFSDLTSAILGQKRKPLYNDDTFNSTHKRKEAETWPFEDRTEFASYIGNKYACILGSTYSTGGGTLKTGADTIRLYSVENLGKVKERENNVKVFDLLDNNVKQELQKYAQSYKGIEKKDELIQESTKIDLDNLSLTHTKGKWMLQVPVFEQYYHEGNGSSFYTAVEYLPYECKLPASLTSYDKLPVTWNEISAAVPSALDAVGSPNENLLIVITDKELLIYSNPKAGLENPVKKFTLQTKERIVLNQWALGDYVEQWDKTLSKKFK